MRQVSTITRMEVKPKLTNSPAPFNTAGPMCTPPPADQPAKPAQAQDLQKSDPGARAGSGLQKDIAVPQAERKGKKTSQAARYLVAIVHGYLGYGRWGYLSENTIARVARRGRWWVIKARDEAVAAGYLDMDDNGKCNRYHVRQCVRHLAKTWVNPALVRDNGLSISEAVVLSDLKFRQGENYATWPTIQERAELLGVSYHSIARADTSIAALGYIQRRHRPWRRSSKNEYYLTCQGKEATGVFEPKTARPKARALGETIMAKSYSYANKVRNDSLRASFGLSFNPETDGELYQLLVKFGAHPSVAKSIAVEWRHDPESVRQAMINAAHRVEASAKKLRRLNLSRWRGTYNSYLIGTLNRARREGHRVPPSRLVRADELEDDSSARAAARSPPSASEFEQRKKEQIRRLFLSPVESITPYTELELALIAQNRDKEAEAKYLDAVLVAARSRSWRYRKYANLGHKLHISTKLDRQVGISV